MCTWRLKCGEKTRVKEQDKIIIEIKVKYQKNLRMESGHKHNFYQGQTSADVRTLRVKGRGHHLIVHA